MNDSVYMVFDDNKRGNPNFHVFTTMMKALDFVQTRFLSQEGWFSIEQKLENILQWGNDEEYVSIYKLTLNGHCTGSSSG
jgi:hypothetical protein